MQQDSPRKPAPIHSFLALAGCLILTGCPKNPSDTATIVEAKKPYEGLRLTVRCPNPEITAALTPVAKSWSAKTGATVLFASDEPLDITILPSVDFGRACSQGEFQTLNKAIRQPLHPFQINGQTDAYYEGLAGWQGQPHGVVLATDAAVLVYRKDRFDDIPTRASFKTRTSRDLVPPTNWDDFNEIAAFFAAKDGKPSLAHMTRDTTRLLDLFHRIAACTDRPAMTPSNLAGRNVNEFAAEAFSFTFDFASGQPRLTSPGFTMAIETLNQMVKYQTKDDIDPVPALLSGQAVMAIVTMHDLAQLAKQSENSIPTKLSVARLPGSKRYYDSFTKQIETMKGNDPNFVPFLGGGWIGGVLTRCQNTDAAFDLLGEFGGPTGAAAIVSRPVIGSGPWRASLLEANKKNLWYGYGFDADQTQALMTALKPYVASDIRNPAVAARGPGITEFMAILAVYVRRGALGELPPKQAMAAAQENAILAESTLVPTGKVTAWRRADMRSK